METLTELDGARKVLSKTGWRIMVQHTRLLDGDLHEVYIAIHELYPKQSELSIDKLVRRVWELEER